MKRASSGDCDFEWDNAADLAVPRPIARGNVARSIFYMHTEYGAPIDERMEAVLRRWHCQDPPSTRERRRNNAIEAIQSTRNPFIDNPRIVSCTEVDSALKASTLFADLGRAVQQPPANISQPPVAAACCKICRKGKGGAGIAASLVGRPAERGQDAHVMRSKVD